MAPLNPLTPTELQLSRLRAPVYGASSHDLRRPAATWIESDLYQQEPIQALAIILRTQGCSWARNHGGCTMCGYTQDSALTCPDPSDLNAQFSFALKKVEHTPVSVIKIFTSGSFFDDAEITPALRHAMLQQLTHLPTLRNVIIETRPEYLTLDVLADTKRILAPLSLELAIGLETSNDYIRETYIHKGFLYQDFSHAAQLIRSQHCALRAYLLLKPPFLTEAEAIEDTLHSAITAVQDGATTISINPSAIHAGTLLEQLWRKKWYRPPRLWSVVETLQRIRLHLPPSVNVISHPVAGGKPRGPHNCGRCDKRVLAAIRNFSLSQNPEDLQHLSCSCKHQWSIMKQLETVNREPLLDDLIQRYLPPG